MEPLLGEIKIFAGNFAPQGWFSCEGQLLPISSYTALFSILGTTYGGNGTTTFALPDLRGTFPTQYNSIGGTPPSGSSYALGQRGGSPNATITGANLPAHTHVVTGSGGVSFKASSAAASTADPVNGVVLAQGGDPGVGANTPIYNTATPDITLGGVTFNASGMTLSPAYTGGSSSTIPVSPPYLAMIYIMAWQGVYPSRP